MAQKRMRVLRTRGRSEMRGVTRYQWASTTAAIEPPVTTARANQLQQQGHRQRSPAASHRPRAPSQATPAAHGGQAQPARVAATTQAELARRDRPRTGRWPPGAARRARPHSRRPTRTAAAGPVGRQPAKAKRPAQEGAEAQEAGRGIRDLPQQPGEPEAAKASEPSSTHVM